MAEPAVVATMVESVRGLAIHIAQKAHKVPNGTYDLDDLIQAALLGAISAAQDYDTEHTSEASFSTFAIHRMRQEVMKLYRRSGAAHIPKREYQTLPKAERVRCLFNFAYTSTPLTDDGEVTLEQRLTAPPEPDELFKFAVQKTVKHFLARLSPAERDLIEKVYGFRGEPMSIADAAATRGLSRQRGWQLVQAAMDKIEKMCKRAGVNPAWLDN